MNCNAALLTESGGGDHPLRGLPIEQFAYFLTATPIDAKIKVASAGGGAHVNRFGSIIELKLQVVDETEYQRGDLDMEIAFLLDPDACPNEVRENLQQSLPGVFQTP